MGRVPAFYNKTDLEAAFLKPVKKCYTTKVGGALAQDETECFFKANTNTFDDVVFQRQQRVSINSLSVYDK